MIKIHHNRLFDRKIKGLPVQDKRKVFRAVNGLRNFPDWRHVSKLRKDKHMFRLRVGAYRILFSHSAATAQISIQDVLRRDTQTY